MHTPLLMRVFALRSIGSENQSFLSRGLTKPESLFSQKHILWVILKAAVLLHVHVLRTHYANTPMQYEASFKGCKHDSC